MKELYREFEAILVEESDVLEGLMANLQKEREAIVSYDMEMIASVYKSKHEQLLQVQVLEASRRSVMQQIGQQLGFNGYPTASYLVERAPEKALADRIEQQLSCLRSLAQAVQELNDLQRDYVAHSLDTVQASLTLIDAVRGQGTKTYGENGLLQDRSIQTGSVSRSI